MESCRLTVLICSAALVACFANANELETPNARAEVALAPGGSMEAMTKSTPKSDKSDGLMRRDIPEQHQRLATVEAHTHKSGSASTTGVPPALSELQDGQETTSTPYNHFSPPTPAPPYDPMGAEDGHWVSCGGHRAPRCRVCTVLDPNTGKPFEDEMGEPLDKGPDWCRGNCKWIDGECQDNSRWVEHIEHNHGNATSGEHATTAIPDIINPKLTDTDEELVHMAAWRAIQEADYEARQREANVVQAEEENNDEINKFIKLAMCTCAFCLVCCAIAAVFFVIRYARGGKKQGPSYPTNTFEPEPQLTAADFGGEAVSS
jgi:hypothetical protein